MGLDFLSLGVAVGGEEGCDLAEMREPLESTETYIELDCFGIHPWGHIYHNEGKSNVQLSWLEREMG